jgi:glutamate-1-semialdehyde 2,1-aminomutase
MVSIVGEYDEIGEPDNLISVPHGGGMPGVAAELTVAVPFNDAVAMERRIERLAQEGRTPACVIMEAAAMNMRVIPPEPGYLEAVRDITARYGVVLIFDEVKTGLCIAAGGATERFGVLPDLVTLAKTLGGGLPMGAVGGSHEVMSVVKDGTAYQVGTYNGNPLCAAAARASLLEVLTPPAYMRFEELNARLVNACNKVIENYDIPAYSLGLGAKGCITFSAERIVDYRTFQANRDNELSQLFWVYLFNRGIFAAPNRDQEWTLSVRHDEAAVDAYAVAFEEFAAELTA